MTVVSQLEVIVNGNTRGLESSLRDADGRVGSFAQRAAGRIGSFAMGMGASIIGIGATVVATSANMAIEWESAWTNVEKTVSGSESQLSELQTALREMATDDVLGAMENAHVTLAQIASSAGALGVETTAIDEFTRSVAALSIAADDVSAEEIATAAAQFANVTGMDISTEIDNWANAIARLGNEGASTEGQILSFANRMAALGQMGFDDADILAYSSAMASLGLTAELGGTNFTKSVRDMVAAVATGSPELQEFAEVAGMTAEEFTALGETNPEAAFNAFIQGLSQMDASEQIVQLQEMNITGQEQQRVLQTLAAGYDTVSSSLVTANEAWTSGNDAMEEAARKADTTQGSIDRLKNVLMDTAINIGDNFTPGIERMAGGLADLLQGNWVQGLNEIGGAARDLVNGFLQLFGLSWDDVANFFSRTFDNIGRTFERFFLDIQLKIVEWVAGFRQTILDATGGRVDIAPEMNVNLTNLSVRVNQMDTADRITEALGLALRQEEFNLEDIFFQDQLGRTLNIADLLDNMQFTMGGVEQLAAGFGEQGKQTIQDAIEMAITSGDTGALEVLTPLANELEIDIAQIQADLQAAMAAQSFPVTVTADMTVVPGAMTLPNGMIGPVPPPSGGGAGAVPGATNTGNTVVVNSYGQNPWQMAGLMQQATSDSGVR